MDLACIVQGCVPKLQSYRQHEFYLMLRVQHHNRIDLQKVHLKIDALLLNNL